ncbi:PqqD family peptide modification chaperone [Candidatus Omnitrophota bacterium]
MKDIIVQEFEVSKETAEEDITQFLGKLQAIKAVTLV